MYKRQLLSWRDIEGYMDLYQASPADRSNPYFAPLLAPDLSGMPRTLMLTAEYCPLRDEGEVFAQRLADDGNDVACYRILDAVHGYLLYPPVFRDVYKRQRSSRPPTTSSPHCTARCGAAARSCTCPRACSWTSPCKATSA